jgi:glycosyltransferase involved in cell wall biosynthesis
VGFRLKILAYVNLYPPTTNAGAELMLHEILLELKKRGHLVTVARPNPENKFVDGLEMVSYKEAELIKNEIDIVFTQNHDTRAATVFAGSANKPIVHFVHNDKAVKLFRLNKRNANLIVANSRWVANSFSVPGVSKIVINPPTEHKKYFVERKKADSITFINLIDIKGVDVFWEVAKLMPNKKFLAVLGGYGKQKLPEKPLPNVEIIKNTSDMKKIYDRTRILLVPSKYESWGRVGVEAMVSGIPVIAANTPGLRESLGDAAIFVTEQKASKYCDAISSLDSEEEYFRYSYMSYQRSKEIISGFNKQIDNLEKYIVEIVR